MFSINQAMVLAGAAMCCIAASGANASEPSESPGPEQAAAGFIAQVYSVKPEQVSVTVLNRDRNTATVVTNSSGQPTCSLDLTASPQSDAASGWLLGGIVCDTPSDRSHG